MREKNYQGNQRFFDSIHKNLLKTTLQLWLQPKLCSISKSKTFQILIFCYDQKLNIEFEFCQTNNSWSFLQKICKIRFQPNATVGVYMQRIPIYWTIRLDPQKSDFKGIQ